VTGDINPSITGTPYDSYEITVECTTSGTTGTSFSYKIATSVDANGDPVFGSPINVTTALSFAIAGTGLTVHYSTGRTFTSGDVFTFYTLPASASILPSTMTRVGSSTSAITVEGSPE